MKKQGKKPGSYLIQFVKVQWTAKDQLNRVWDRFKILAISENITVQKLLARVIRQYVGSKYE